MPNCIGFSDLKKWLKHRHPMILLDRVIDYEVHKYLKAIVCVSGASDWAGSHFPDRAIYPSSNIMQAFTQAGSIFYQMCTDKVKDNEMTVLGSIQLRFYHMIFPGDQITLIVKKDKLIQGHLFFTGTAFVGSKRVTACRASITKIIINENEKQIW
ncbi:MAG: beta-hydroxyacyl-ACP dehydratase [Ignavibacteriae bacterium]|nr:MAG: beta-hydroxyacyl-ACP dehydratase [Ignavibacteriota bacterium]